MAGAARDTTPQDPPGTGRITLLVGRSGAGADKRQAESQGSGQGSGQGNSKSGDTAGKPQLYAPRKKIYPKLAHGTFRTAKWAMMILALGIYYLLPWIRWPRGEGAPDQAVLADFANERFYFFFLEIWPQEVYYITGLLILASLGLFLVTSLFGRVWCGYACPQTVWTDLYIFVERALEGDRAARMRLDKAPNTASKIARKVTKHAIWLLIALLTGGAFVFYFHDAPTVAAGALTGEAPLSAYVFAGVLTATTYSLAGLMREQVCTYMCPWPRIQGALTDEHALNVTYRYDRGEPRAPLRKGQDWSERGDCIDCNQCVQVCPMGIDIRDGAQLECIHCALCIDACDEMMRKIGRPTGLIAYDNETAVQARARGEAPRYRLVRTRTVLYAVLIALVSGIMLTGLATRATFELNVLKDRSPPYVQLADGGVRNGYVLKVVNKESRTRTLDLSLSGLPGATLEVVGPTEVEGLSAGLDVAPNGVDRFRILVSVAPEHVTRRTSFEMTLRDPETGETHTNTVPFVGPGDSQ